MSADEDELVAEIVGVFDDLVAEGHLELASRRGSTALAMPLLSLLERDLHASIGDWLLEREEVTELYLEQDELHARFRTVIKRMSGDEPVAKYHPALAAAIAAAPEDLQARSVYADWLIEQGDPRGELMAIQLERTAGRADRRLADREKAILSRHRRHFFGDLASAEEGADGAASYTLRHGFLDEVTVSNEHDLQSLLALESARFLRKLTVRSLSLDAIGERLAAATLPSTLVELDLGVPDPYAGGNGGSLDLARAVRGVARLEVLVVRNAMAITLPALETPRLRRLIVEARTLHVDEGAFVALPDLERLGLRVSRINPPAALVALFGAPPSGLAALTITRMESARALLDSLLASPLARTLRQLALGHNRLTNGDASLLLAQREQLACLETLSLVGNRISEPIQRQLQDAWPGAKVEFSRPVNDDGAYDEDDDEDDEERYDDGME